MMTNMKYCTRPIFVIYQVGIKAWNTISCDNIAYLLGKSWHAHEPLSPSCPLTSLLQVSAVLDVMGEASAKAQGLKTSITSGGNTEQKHEHRHRHKHKDRHKQDSHNFWKILLTGLAPDDRTSVLVFSVARNIFQKLSGVVESIWKESSAVVRSFH